MEQKHLVLSGCILVLIIVGMFAFTYMKKQEFEDKATAPVPISEEPTETRFDYVRLVTAKHFYVDGIHTLIGEIEMPTPCDLLQSDYIVMESYPEQIIIDFTVINDSDMCTQVITPAKFQIKITASEQASIRAKFEGKEIDLNLLPTLEGETLEDFELYTEE